MEKETQFSEKDFLRCTQSFETEGKGHFISVLTMKNELCLVVDQEKFPPLSENGLTVLFVNPSDFSGFITELTEHEQGFFERIGWNEVSRYRIEGVVEGVPVIVPDSPKRAEYLASPKTVAQCSLWATTSS